MRFKPIKIKDDENNIVKTIIPTEIENIVIEMDKCYFYMKPCMRYPIVVERDSMLYSAWDYLINHLKILFEIEGE